jgi:hypothetical protein
MLYIERKSVGCVYTGVFKRCIYMMAPGMGLVTYRFGYHGCLQDM